MFPRPPLRLSGQSNLFIKTVLKKIPEMKTNYRAAFLLMGLLLAISGFSTKLTPTLMLPVHIVFSAKSYWDGATKSCLPREKGGCCHIWLEGMEPGPGEISGEMVLVKNKIIQLTVSRGKGLNRETWLKYFSDNFQA